jgi:hypothetical protein
MFIEKQMSKCHSFLLHVSALHGCHHQGFFTVIIVLPLKLPAVCSTVWFYELIFTLSKINAIFKK